jgi:hypothetical protein
MHETAQRTNIINPAGISGIGFGNRRQVRLPIDPASKQALFRISGIVPRLSLCDAPFSRDAFPCSP